MNHLGAVNSWPRSKTFLFLSTSSVRQLIARLGTLLCTAHGPGITVLAYCMKKNCRLAGWIYLFIIKKHKQRNKHKHTHCPKKPPIKLQTYLHIIVDHLNNRPIDHRMDFGLLVWGVFCVFFYVSNKYLNLL